MYSTAINPQFSKSDFPTCSHATCYNLQLAIINRNRYELLMKIHVPITHKKKVGFVNGRRVTRRIQGNHVCTTSK